MFRGGSIGSMTRGVFKRWALRFSSWLPAVLAVAIISPQAVPVHAAAWEPTKPVEFVVPAGTGGGADQMARFLQGVVAMRARRCSAVHTS